jgi:nitrogen fixation protein FixH
MRTQRIKPFTGRHMVYIMIAFFGVIIAVNLTMATLASRTFGGKVVENSYVASQKFNDWLAESRAQERLGWTTQVRVDRARRVTVKVATANGTLAGATVEAIARHPLGRAPERILHFTEDQGGFYRSGHALPLGRWQLHFAIRRGRDVKRSIEVLS